MDVRKIDIQELLLQQPPFVMVDRLEHYDEKQTVTSFEVKADCIFVDDSLLDVSAIAENIAQTCAVRLGYINKYVLFRPIQLGFIGAIRKLQVGRTPKVGERLITKIEVLEEVIGITLVRASVLCGKEEVATGEMKIAIQDEATIKE